MIRLTPLWFMVLLVVPIHAQTHESILYKQVDTTALYMDIHFPENINPDSTYPCIVFFHGGGWVGGSITQFEPHATHYNKKGIICCLVNYRVASQQKTTPFESLKDAKSAMRFIRRHAEKYHINPDKIIASGGSAGGHLAAATALIEGFNEKSDDLDISPVPNALILFNPVIDNGPGGYAFERIGDKYKEFSPLHNINAGAPPTIFFLGTNDILIPVETARYYQTVMEKVGSRCDLFIYEGQGHGFFNFRNPEFYQKTVSEADKFLVSLGYLR